MYKKPFVLAIAGGTCSGKSTLTNLLSEELGEKYKVAPVHMDMYFRRPSITTIAPVTKKEYAEHNHPDALNQEKLFADFDALTQDESIDLIIVEGLFGLYFDEILDRADLKVYVDLRPDQRLYRRITRWLDRQSLEEICERYVDTVSFRHDELVEPTRWRADMVINGNLDANLGKEVLKNYLTGKLG